MVLVNDVCRHSMTHSTQMWWDGTSTMMTRSRCSYRYLDAFLGLSCGVCIEDFKDLGVRWECLALFLGSAHFLQCRRRPASWGWLLVLCWVDFFLGTRQLGFKGKLYQGWGDVTFLCKSCIILDWCVVLGWWNGECVLLLSDRYFISRLIMLPSLWITSTFSHIDQQV